MPSIPKREQLLFPSMEIISAAGGSMKSNDVVDALAERFGVSSELVNFKEESRSSHRSFFKNEVHWMRHNSVQKGYFERSTQRGTWTLSDQGYEALQMCVPGVAFTIFETSFGQAIWSEAETAVDNLKDNSVNLIFTSPPYPIETGMKEYGNKTGKYYVDWLCEIAKGWKRALTSDGSIILNLGDVWEKGRPTRSLYIERLLIALVDSLGLHLCDHNYWECPN